MNLMHVSIVEKVLGMPKKEISTKKIAKTDLKSVKLDLSKLLSQIQTKLSTYSESRTIITPNSLQKGRYRKIKKTQYDIY
jgi:hypothetical protein